MNHNAIRAIMLMPAMLIGLLGGSPAAPSDADSARLEALRQCARLVEMNKADSEEFLREARGLCETFSEVKPQYVTGEMNFTPVALNESGTGFDAIRFRTKAGYDWQMVWCFSAPAPSGPDDPEWGNLRNWYIIRRNGEMKGFSHPGRSHSGAGYKGAPWNEKQSFTIQALDYALLPNEEYLIWFQFADERPAEMFLQICLVPWDSWRGTSSEISVFGLQQRPVPIPEDPDSQLVACAMHRDMEGVMAAVNRGADINAARDSLGMSALSWAVVGFKGEMVTFLLDHGAAVNERDDEGYTPLHQAARVLRTEHAVLLLVHGADVNARDNSGRTPLQLIPNSDAGLGFVQLLVEEGADLLVTNRHGQTPIEKARSEGCARIVEYLEGVQALRATESSPGFRRGEQVDGDGP